MDMNTNSPNCNPAISVELQDGSADGGRLHSDIYAIGHRGICHSNAFLHDQVTLCTCSLFDISLFLLITQPLVLLVSRVEDNSFSVPFQLSWFIYSKL